MAFRVACLSCGHKFTVGDKPSGKQDKCPKCGSTAQIQLFETAQPAAQAPEPDEVAPEPAAIGRIQPEAEEPVAEWSPGVGRTEDRPLPSLPTRTDRAGPRVRPRVGRQTWIMVAAIGVLVVVAWAIYSAVKSDGERPEAITAESPLDQAPGFGPGAVEEPWMSERGGPGAVEGVTPAATEAFPREAADGLASEAPENPSAGPAMPGGELDPDGQPEMAEPTWEPTPVLPPGAMDVPPAQMARSLEEAQNALVKFEMPLGIGDLKSSGTGFLMDARGWIATNHHVLKHMTKATRVKLADGSLLELEGVVARAPERDLAIVKLKAPPDDLSVFDISYDGDVPLGEEVYAFGHPYETEFSLSKGIVGRVVTTGQLKTTAARYLLAKIGAPDDMIWIQHDAKISPGNSGGPLIGQSGRVLGVNTFVHTKAEFGYASHVTYLRQLTASASELLEPLPEPREFVRTVVSSDRINQLFDEISTFGWKPETADQYESIAEFAKQVTLAKHARELRSRTPNLGADVIRRVALVADQKYAALREVPWTMEHFQAINAFAADQIDRTGEGALLYSTVIGSARNPNGLFLRIEGTGKLIFLQTRQNSVTVRPGSRWLVLGFVVPRVFRGEDKSRSAAVVARQIVTHYMLLVRTQSD